MNAIGLYSSVAAGVVVGGAGLAWLFLSRRKTPEERERMRRQRLSAIGRITDGNVVDVQEVSNGASGTTQLLIYNYDISGVAYEASQDITHLGQLIDLNSVRLSLPISIKYDPHNPGDSIVIAESWTGLHNWSDRIARHTHSPLLQRDGTSFSNA